MEDIPRSVAERLMANKIKINLYRLDIYCVILNSCATKDWVEDKCCVGFVTEVTDQESVQMNFTPQEASHFSLRKGKRVLLKI